MEVKIKVSYNHPEIGRGNIVPMESCRGWKCGEGVKIDLTGDIFIDDMVEIQDEVMIFTHRHHWRHSRGVRAKIQEVERTNLFIGRDAFIGARAMLIGVEKIGEGAVIGGGAVVRARRVGAFEVWTGNPAQCDGARGE